MREAVSTDVLFITTSRGVFEALRRSLDKELEEYRGKPGFTAVLGRYSDREMLLACIPPYSHAIVDSIREFYVVGVRKVIFFSEGLRLKGEHEALLAISALPRDSASKQIASLSLPPVASLTLLQALLGARGFSGESVVLESGVSVALGTAISVDSLANENALKRVLVESRKLRGAIAIDCCTSALYSLHHVYAIDSLSVILMALDVSKARTFLPSTEAERVSETVRELSLKIFPILFEKVVKSGEESRVQS
ncbi:MAG: hypothetical protein QXF57_04135 [Acidilobaceae archaeon]